ncbi:MAG TPA: PH domain-containing protein [Acidobacteriota bacterium]|jgi:uncharacterized membrane protein YdbT with pleckstrin-like domain|nr:PH domain-containing protein [Acidobacteriota bacterium]
MDYVDKLLGSSETITFRTHRHFFVIFGAILKEFLILLACGVAFVFVNNWYTGNPLFFYIGIAALALWAVISALVDIVRWKNDEFVVTNRRVIRTSGVFSKNILDSSLNKINDVILQQSWFGRLFNYGTIKILTATEEVINLLDNIRNPIGFKHAMLESKSLMEPVGVPQGFAAPASATQLLEELEQLRARKMISDTEYEEKRKEILKRM